MHMKQGGRFAKKSAGFTIAETMIVLAVSGGLFLIAALYIGGKQAKTEFQVGVRDVQTRLQQIIAQTQSGYYGVQSTIGCSTTNPLTPPDLSITSSASLGTNGECIFIGKAIVVDSTDIYVFPLAGARQSAGEDTQDPVAARATVALPAGRSPEKFPLPNGITLVKSSYDNGSLVAGQRGFAILTSMSKGADSATGSQTFDLFGFSPSSSFAGLPAGFRGIINGEKQNAGLAYPSKNAVGLCLKSGGTDQSALITIGGVSGLALRTDIKSGISCN